jgi:dihydrofolate synthase/folylpolyglutamate synthase
LDLKGDYQQKNVLTVLAAINILRRSFDIPDNALEEGLAHAASLTGLRGRWQFVGRDPLVVLDTAHNAHGLREVAVQIARQKYGKLYMVLGFAGDKDIDAIMGLLPPDAHYILTQAAVGRAMPAEKLTRLFTAHGFDAETATPSSRAVQRALSLAAPEDMVYIGGSNYIVGEALSYLDC